LGDGQRSVLHRNDVRQAAVDAYFFIFSMVLSIFIIVSAPSIIEEEGGPQSYDSMGHHLWLIAVLCLIPPLVSLPQLFYFAPLLLVLLAVNIWFVKQKSERAFLNDLCAILIFSLGGAAAYLLGEGGWDRTMILVVVFNLLYFMGTVFFVKSVFRERKSKRWVAYAQVYHVILLLIPWVLGNPWMGCVYLFATVRTFALAGKVIRPMKVGIIEIIGAVQFLILTVILI
jgi:hypothetical protein